jgi:DNA-binding PadR family transcriptional regulator
MQKENNSYLIPRGILKSYILLLLEKKPMHGYAIIQEIQKKTKFWKPSPGTIYPQLAALVKEGAIKKKLENRRYVYSLTKHGKRMSTDVAAVKQEFQKKSFETLAAILTEKDLIKLQNKFAKKCFKDKMVYELIIEMNNIRILLLRHYTHSNHRAEESKEILTEARRKLEKLLQ